MWASSATCSASFPCSPPACGRTGSVATTRRTTRACCTGPTAGRCLAGRSGPSAPTTTPSTCIIRWGDEDQANIEVQSGPLELQTDFMLCPPGVANLWKECWLPVSKIKHPLHTDANFSLGFSPGEAESTFHLFSYRTYKDLTATVQRGDSRQTAALARVLPGTVQPITLTGRNVDPVACRVLVKDSHGQVRLPLRPGRRGKAVLDLVGTDYSRHGDHGRGLASQGRLSRGTGRSPGGDDSLSQGAGGGPRFLAPR